MSEPPEDDGLSDEESAELEEFLNSEYFAELSDDMLLDDVGEGKDHRTIYDDMPDEEWELQDHLADIKEQTEDEPIPELVSTEEAMKIIADAKKKHDEEKAAAERRAQSQGEDKVAISDDAQQLAVIGNDETAAGALNAAATSVSTAINLLSQVGEALSSVGQAMQHAQETVTSQSAQAGGLLGGDGGQAISGEGQAIGSAISDALSVIATVDTTAAQNTLTGVDLSAMVGRLQGLYTSIKDAASKHQG